MDNEILNKINKANEEMNQLKESVRALREKMDQAWKEQDKIQSLMKVVAP